MRLLKVLTRKCLTSNAVSNSSFLRHCSASEAVGLPTVRCSDLSGGTKSKTYETIDIGSG